MRNSPLISTYVVGVLMLAAHADEPASTPTDERVRGTADGSASVAEKEVGWLSVGVTEVDPVVADHLGLPEHTGLAVEFIVPDGPAEKAGLQRHDILTKFDDQLLVLQQQLEILVWNRKQGNDVVLTLLRKGDELKLAATLGVRRVPIEPQPNQEEVIARMLLRDFPQMHKYLDENGNLPGVRSSLINVAEREVTLRSDDCSVCFDRRQGKPYVRVRDTDGHLVYEGFLEDKEGLKQLPKNLRDRVDALISMLDGNLMLALPSDNDPPAPSDLEE